MQAPGTRLARLWFTIGPAGGRFPGGQVRTFPDHGENLAPGEHVVTVTWDGKDDQGRPVPAGVYRLYAQALVRSTNHVVTCADGSGEGVERSTGTEGAGLGHLVVRKTAPSR